MKKIIFSSPFLAGEELLCWILGHLTGLMPFQPDQRKLVTDHINEDWVVKNDIVTGHFTPTNEMAVSFSSNETKFIFLVRNIYDLLVDQYRYFSKNDDNISNCQFAQLTQKEGITLLITGGELDHFSLPGLGVWVHQMQEILHFSTRHHCYVLSYEKLLQHPAAQIKGLANFLGSNLTDVQLSDLVAKLSREIRGKTGAQLNATSEFYYSFPCGCVGVITPGHSHMIKNILLTHAPDLGHISTALKFPEVTARSRDLPRPILDRVFISSVFKSGTKLIEHIVSKLTNLASNSPGMEVGCDYESADPIMFESGKFFIWHNVPSEAVKARLRAEDAIPIFLIRNIYDLAVSQYFHFADDVDAAIGHSTGTIEYFKTMEQDEGISLVLCGATSNRFHWHGFGYYLRQIQEILKFSTEHPCHLVMYDRLVMDKRIEIARLADFLDVEIDSDVLNALLGSSTLTAMREARIAAVGSGKHFRMGAPGSHKNVLRHYHYHMIDHLKLVYAPMLDSLCTKLGFGDLTSRTLTSIE